MPESAFNSSIVIGERLPPTPSVPPLIGLRRHATLLLSFLVVVLLLTEWLFGYLPVVAASSQIPKASVKAPHMVQEESVSTYVPSESSPKDVIAVNIIYPELPRYPDGAPIAVVVPGGDGSSGLDFTIHAGQCGFAEVRFAFPGGGLTNFGSSGIYDYRGGECQRVLKDVLLFASGKIVDYQGRSIAKLVPKKLSLSNVGVVAWSDGGNVALTTMAKYARRLPFISWIAFCESPVGSLLFPPNLGSVHDLVLNRHYRLGSGATGKCFVDFRKIWWEPLVKRHSNKYAEKKEPEIPGVLFFDENGNRKWDEGTEFVLNYALDVGLEKQIYAPPITAALKRLEVFAKFVPIKSQKPLYENNSKDGKLKERVRSEPQLETNKEGLALSKEIVILNNRKYEKYIDWPSSIATLPESEAYFEKRDGSLYIRQVSTDYPNLLIGIFGSELDHLTRQPDHPHIALLYNNFLANKAHWVRLNPDPLYVGRLADMNQRNFVNNLPNSPIDASAMDSLLEPEGLIPDYVFVQAQIAELADRKRTGKSNAPLEGVLVDYASASKPQVVPKN